MGMVESLHCTKPTEIFQGRLENLAATEAVAGSILWRGSSVTSDWSNKDVAKVLLLVLALDEEKRRKHL